MMGWVQRDWMLATLGWLAGRPKEPPMDQAERDYYKLRMYMNLILPGLYRFRERYHTDWRHPVKELDLRVDRVLNVLVVMAYWKDGTIHESHLTLAQLQEDPGWFQAFTAAIDKVCPRSYFDDEVVVGYDC